MEENLMKRTIALMLSALLLLLAVPLSTSAAPESKCILFDERGAYAKFADNFAVGTNGSVSFDLAMGTSSDGDPIVKVNGDELQITKNSVVISGSSTPITWGALDTTHWRKVDISYSGNNATVSLDGVVVASHSGSFTKNLLYFLNYPGTILVDNVRVTSAGAEVGFADFDTTANFAQSIVEKTCNRTDVPANSYYDYTEVTVPDNVYYVFNSAANAAKLTIQAGVEMYRGDLNEDNTVNVRDLSVLRKAIAGDGSIIYNKTIADINADTVLNTRDVLALKKVIAGLDPLTQVTIAGAGSGTATYDQAMDAALLTSSDATADGIDANLTMTAINASDYPYAVITYMTPNKTDDHNSAVATQSAFGAWGNLKDYTLNTDGKFHSEIVDLSDVSTWNGDAATLRFFKAANVGDRIYIDSIVFTANLSKANSAKAEREAAKADKSIVDVVEPDPTGKIGDYDENGNYVIRFDERAKIDAKVSATNNTRVTFGDTALRAIATAGADPSCYVDLIDENISASTFKYIVYVYKNPSSNATVKGANLYYVCNDIDVPTRNYETDVLGGSKGDQYFATVYDLTGKSNWTGAIKGLRIDYFTDCSTNDCSFIDSIIFATSQANANKGMSARLRARNGASASDTAGVWNNYWAYCKNANDYEFISGDNTDLTMYFKYGSYDALTARSLGDRMARAITNATGFEVTCYLTGLQFAELKGNWGNSQPEANIYYCIKYEGVSYVVCVRTCIIKINGYTDPLDGTPADPVLDYYDLSAYQSTPGYSITDVHEMGTYSTSLAYHSNHESKMCETPYGAFTVYHTSGGNGNQNYCGGGQTSVFRVLDNGTCKKIFTFNCTSHTTKPYIHYGDDGLVYFVQADDEENMSTCAISIGYFDPSQPKSDGTYNITYTRETKGYPGGAAWSGYGYSSSVIDPSQGKIYIVYNGGGGNRGYYLCWFVYNYRNHTWGSSHNVILTQTHRHCYTYLFPDGNGGMYIVGERDVLLADIGLAGICTGADYAWDEINMIHIPNVDSTNYTFRNVFAADYTQTGRELYPGYMNSYSECYLDSNSKLHVFWTKAMHGRNIRDGKSVEGWHAVYNVTGGISPALIYKEPISFTHPNNCYTIRFCENTSGQLFILAMPTESPRVEVWKATNADGTQFELKHYKNIGIGPVTAFVAGTKRTNSVVDNTVSCALPCGGENGSYYSFVVTLPAN